MVSGEPGHVLTHRAAVVGSPIGHSLSPVLHRAAYEALGLTDWDYDRMAVGGPGEPDLATVLGSLGPEWIGLSVTMPLKEEALALSTAASARARRLGGANTLVRREDGWVADATDPEGIEHALADAGVRGARSALVLAAGATARAALEALARIGVRHVGMAVRGDIRPQTVDLARTLGQSLMSVSLPDLARDDLLERAVGGVDVVVSTLPAGALVPGESWQTTSQVAGAVAEPDQRLTGSVVLDVVYDGWPTPLARWAVARGATVVSGLEMLLYQAVEQVQLMTGRTAPVEQMRAALDAAAASGH